MTEEWNEAKKEQRWNIAHDDKVGDIRQHDNETMMMGKKTRRARSMVCGYQ